MVRLKTLWCGARRRLLVYLHPTYVIKSLDARRGKCKMCGKCCKINLPNCKYLKGKRCELGKLCIQKDKKFWCWVFPIDRRDQELSDVEKDCGYYWKKKR